MTFLPTRLISRFAGYLANSHPPNSFKALFLGNYSKLYGCNLQEIDLNATFENSGKQFPDVADLHDTREIFDLFPTVQSFFSRRIKQREVDQSALVSPVDGTVLSFGEVNGDDTVEQVKGIRYSIPALVGERFQPTSPDNKINHVIIYLAPGDYHGIHAPADFHVQRRKHFPGELLPVAPLVARSVPSLFAINERVALNGSWSHGFFSLISVGATNVGSITVKFDPVRLPSFPSLFVSFPFVSFPLTPQPMQEMKTNNAKDRLLPLTPFERDFGANAVACIKGEEVAFFHLGSTVILVFESPKDFSFTLKPGQKLKYGQNIGDIASFPLA